MQKKNVNKKIKILFQGLSTNLGGIETYLYNLCRNIDRNKFEISFMVFDYGKKVCFEDELINLGAKIYKITPRTKNYFKFKKDLKNLYKNNEFDFIHFNLMDFSCFERITLANKYSKAKIIIHSHNAGFGKNISKKTRILHQIGKFKLRKIEYLKVACGEQAGKWMFKDEAFEVFYNGIDIEKFTFNNQYREEIRDELQIDYNTILIGLVGKFEKQKNHEFLIKIFYEYIKYNDNCKLVLIGEGSLKQNIIKQVEEFNISENVIFLGKREDTYKIYSAMDFFLMPSLYEGLSIALVEAQVNGLKCYTSDSVDINSNISGNVEFLPLQKSAKYWAEYIFKNKIDRDINILKKIPEKFDSKKSYEKVFKFYQNNLK